MMPAALRLLQSERPLVIGHRGYARFGPENTLPSIELALAAGADLVEFDYRHSNDGIPVVIHDADLDRTTDARRRWRGKRIKVESKTAAEIQSLDAGAWFHPRYAGTKVPLLEEALQCVGRRSLALIERKAGDATTCARLLRARKLVNRIVVQSFDWQFLCALHQQLPEQVLAALGPPSRLPDGRKPRNVRRRLSEAWLDRMVETGAKVVVWGRLLSGRAVRAAHERGLKVWVYTIDKPQLTARLIELGVNGIITNNPSAMWRVIALRARTSEDAR
jgi:glycerophosphoryl diester phosphodiesterase